MSCTEILAHLRISFYVPDISEIEDLLGIKHGCQTRFPFHVCLIKKGRLHVMTLFSKEKLDRIIAMMHSCITDKLTQNEIEVKFAKYSMHHVFPVLSKLFFLGIHPWVDV